MAAGATAPNQKESSKVAATCVVCDTSFCVLFRRPFKLREIARAIDNADHLHPTFYQPIERQPPFDHQRSGIVSNFRARWAKFRIVSQKLAARFNAIEDAISGDRILRRDMEPDVEQVFGGAARKSNLPHPLRRGETRTGFLFQRGEIHFTGIAAL